MDNRREHAGGTPRADRCNDQWVPLCDFPFEVLDGFAHEEEPPLYPVEKFADALREIAMWLLNDGRYPSDHYPVTAQLRFEENVSARGERETKVEQATADPK